MADAAACSVMVGVGETYFAAFALALGTGETFAGLLATLPQLVGAALQLATPTLLARSGSYRKWVVLCVTLQALALLIMPLAAWLSGRSAAMWLFIAAAAYWAAGHSSAPAWNTWIEDIVPRRLRANFFACRARTSQICTLAGFAAGGIALHFGKSHDWLLTAFAAIFFLAAGSRFLSAWFLRQHSDPCRGSVAQRTFSFRRLFSRQGGEVGLPLVGYLLAMQVAVQISGPYFAPYMLAHQRMSYLAYMCLIGISFLGKAAAMPLWGRVAHHAGARRLLWIGGLSIVPIASLWLGADLFADRAAPQAFLGFDITGLALSPELTYLAAVQFLSGFVWAAYELAILLMFMESIPRQDRPSVLTIYNFGNAAALVAGSLIGAAILQFGNESREAYMSIFATSSVVRLLAVPLLARLPSRSARQAAAKAAAAAAGS